MRKGADAYLICHFARADVADIYVAPGEAVSKWYLATTIKKRPLDPRRFFFIHDLPKVLEPLEPKHPCEEVA